jgi:hypothetical protein
MKDLFDLIPLISQVGPKEARIELLGKLDHSNRVEGRLFRSLLLSQTTNEREIAASIGMQPDDKSYTQAKSHLRRALLDHLFFLDLARADYSEYSQKSERVWRLREQALLAGSFVGARLADELAALALPDALEIEEWSVALDLISMLQNGAALSGDKKEWNRLKREYWSIFALNEAEQEARLVQQKITLVFARSGAEHPELRRTIVPAIRKLEAIAKKHGTFKLHEQLLELKRKLLQVQMDYPEALMVADQGLALLKKYPIFANRARRSRYGQAKFASLIQMERLDEAEIVQKEIGPLLNPESDNWYYFQNWSFILLMHRERFEEAYTLCESVMHSRRYSTQTDPLKDTWELYLLYSKFFTGRALPGTSTKRLGKTGHLSHNFVRLFPSFKGDHAGYRVAAIILEILVLLSESSGKSDLIERAESLIKFKSRHLKGHPNTQSNLFIDLTQLLGKFDFNEALIVKTARPIVKEMVSIKTIDKYQGQQVMTYKWLWAKTVSYLRKARWPS